MGVGKIIGYVVSILGIALVAAGVIPALKTAVKFIPSSLSNTYLMIIGAILVIIGIIPIIRSSPSGKQAAEVPIYHGKEIVGYRRIKK